MDKQFSKDEVADKVLEQYDLQRKVAKSDAEAWEETERVMGVPAMSVYKIVRERKKLGRMKEARRGRKKTTTLSTWCSKDIKLVEEKTVRKLAS